MIQLTDYITLGRSGLKVSPICLGTVTFGNYYWGSDDTQAKQVFFRYIELGGNFVDTADEYSNGKSEELIGSFIKESDLRDQVVLATKFTFNTADRNPNAGGNGRKNIYRALEGSLRRLKTDYVDLYWLHAWDMVTPVEEVIFTLADLVRTGKIRYFGLSDVPAWYVSRASTLAECRGLERPIALQLEYSLVERTVEREHIPAARALEMGVCPWGPLASGFLADKYQRDRSATGKNTRLDALGAGNNPVYQRFSDKNWKILDVLRTAAHRLNRRSSQVALNWVINQHGITSTLIGARQSEQLEDNLAALEFEIPPEIRCELDEASRLDSAHPYMFFESVIQSHITGGVNVRKWS